MNEIVSPVCKVRSDWQGGVNPAVGIFDHGGPHGDLLLRGVHPADALAITLTWEQAASTLLAFPSTSDVVLGGCVLDSWERAH